MGCSANTTESMPFYNTLKTSAYSFVSNFNLFTLTKKIHFKFVTNFYFIMQYICESSAPSGSSSIFSRQSPIAGQNAAGFSCSSLSSEDKRREELHPTNNDALLVDSDPATILEKSSKPICGGILGTGGGGKLKSSTEKDKKKDSSNRGSFDRAESEEN